LCSAVTPRRNAPCAAAEPELGKRAADAAVQVHGGYGYISDYRVEQLYRDARLGEIGEGVSEIQRMLIARSLLF